MPTLIVPGDLNSLAAIADMVVEQATLAGLDKHDAYQLQLAVDELATNSIVHGYQEHGLEGSVWVSANVTDEALTIVVEDEAVPFDPRQRDVVQIEESFDDPLHERPIGGLGVYFVMHAVDEFDYQRKGNRNRNILVVRRPGAGNEPKSAATTEARS
jgi:anti-sigma regulatory factor (Ser/Thr protein kinase)